VAGIVGLIFTVGMWIASLVWKLFLLITCSLGCIVFPIYIGLIGVAGFWAIQTFLPGWISINANIWQIILMGVLTALIRIHAPESFRGKKTDSD
jgi:hypothetical protein